MSSRTGGRIQVEVADGLATVVIDNPAQRNALTRAMCLAIQELMPGLDADPDVAVIVLRGAGDTFCAGAAISELPAVLMDRQDDGTLLDHLSLADRAIADLRKPTMAMVDGACMGGGWQLASACDFIMASERSLLAITPARLGIIYPRAGIDRLVRQVGPATAKFILLTGEVFTSRRAQRLGLVAESVPDDVFEERCMSLVQSLRDHSRFSMYSMKRLVDFTASGHPGVDQEWADAWSAMPESPDMGIGMNAFLSRERPQFSWRPAG